LYRSPARLRDNAAAMSQNEETPAPAEPAAEAPPAEGAEAKPAEAAAAEGAEAKP